MEPQIWLLLAMVILSACASSSVERIGSAAYAPLLPDTQVSVFTAENQIKQPFEVVGIISYDNPGKYRILSLGDAIEPLKEKARSVGANGIIVDQSNPINRVSSPRVFMWRQEPFRLKRS